MTVDRGRRGAGKTAGGGERIQKVLARSGLGSRREIEVWITAGRISINGCVATLGARAMPSDRLSLDGRRLPIAVAQPPVMRVIALNKPVGVVCTRDDPEGRPTVFSWLPPAPDGRWIGVGRLDLNTGGLLLFTNHGELAQRLMHPRYHIDREYAVRVFGTVTDTALQRLQAGVDIDGQRGAFDVIARGNGRGANHWYRCVVRRGRHREVRRLWESQGVSVSRLQRVRFGNIVLPQSLPAGGYFAITGELLAGLCALVALEPATAEHA